MPQRSSLKNKLVVSLLFLLLITSYLIVHFLTPKSSPPQKENKIQITITPFVKSIENIKYHEPRYGAQQVPKDYGFWSFAYIDGKKISRSGQPNKTDFKFLKTSGYKTIISLRYPGEYEEVTDDSKLSGLPKDFNYVSIPIKDGGVPTEQQLTQFFTIINDSKNYPIHIHCRAGIGRTGVMTALYRYKINGWPINKAIEESRLFEGGVSQYQTDWLIKMENKK